MAAVAPCIINCSGRSGAAAASGLQGAVLMQRDGAGTSAGHTGGQAWCREDYLI